MKASPSGIKNSKKKLIHYSELCYRNKFFSDYEGNLSVRFGNQILITASNTCKGMLKDSDIIKVSTDGKSISSGKKPSTEFKLHCFIYQKRRDVNAVIHTHPIFATAFAATGLALDKMVLPEVIIKMKKIPLAGYGTPATEELPKSIEKYINEYDAVLLQNHGLVTYGSSIEDAYFKTEKVEHTAAISFYSRMLGGEKELSKKQIEKLSRGNS